MLGLVEKDALSADQQTTVGNVMEPGPSTWRLDGSLDDIAKYMERHSVNAVIISGSDGRLYGAVRREDISK